MVIGMLAILKAGGAYLPLDPAHPTLRLQLILNDAGRGLRRRWTNGPRPGNALSRRIAVERPLCHGPG
jgi:hypothetical protein